LKYRSLTPTNGTIFSISLIGYGTFKEKLVPEKPLREGSTYSDVKAVFTYWRRWEFLIEENLPVLMKIIIYRHE
jgi:hypothetical protein